MTTQTTLLKGGGSALRRIAPLSLCLRIGLMIATAWLLHGLVQDVVTSPVPSKPGDPGVDEAFLALDHFIVLWSGVLPIVCVFGALVAAGTAVAFGRSQSWVAVKQLRPGVFQRTTVRRASIAATVHPLRTAAVWIVFFATYMLAGDYSAMGYHMIAFAAGLLLGAAGIDYAADVFQPLPDFVENVEVRSLTDDERRQQLVDRATTRPGPLTWLARQQLRHLDRPTGLT